MSAERGKKNSFSPKGKAAPKWVYERLIGDSFVFLKAQETVVE